MSATPTPEAEDSRHRGDVRERSADYWTDIAHDEGLSSRRAEPAPPRDPEHDEHMRRLQRMADAAADPAHPHHQRGLDDLAALEDAEPLFVGMVRSIAAQKRGKA